MTSNELQCTVVLYMYKNTFNRIYATDDAMQRAKDACARRELVRLFYFHSHRIVDSAPDQNII